MSSSIFDKWITQKDGEDDDITMDSTPQFTLTSPGGHSSGIKYHNQGQTMFMPPHPQSANSRDSFTNLPPLLTKPRSATSATSTIEILTKVEAYKDALKAALAQAMSENTDSWTLEEIRVAEGEVRDKTRAYERGLREKLTEQSKEQCESENVRGGIGNQGEDDYIGDVSGKAMQEVRDILSRLHI